MTSNRKKSAGHWQQQDYVLWQVMMSLPIARRGDYCLWVMKNLTHEYKRHDPEETILYKLLEEHAQSFFDMTASDPDRKPLPNFVKREFDKFLSCGVLSEGFVRVKCDDCTQSSVVAFSCKCRGFCPSCAGRRMSERAFNLSDHIIPYVPTRHWVLSVPFELRYWMASDDKLLKKINEILCDEINNYLRKKARKRGIYGWGETGIVSFLQRAGSSLNLNLHFHLLVLDGIYVMSDDGHPIFNRIPGIKDDELSTVMNGISRRAIKYLRKIGKLPAEGRCNLYNDRIRIGLFDLYSARILIRAIQLLQQQDLSASMGVPEFDRRRGAPLTLR